MNLFGQPLQNPFDDKIGAEADSTFSECLDLLFVSVDFLQSLSCSLQTDLPKIFFYF